MGIGLTSPPASRDGDSRRGVRAIVLNGAAGIVFGVLYWRYGLEWAMASHFGADLVLHVIVGA